MKYECRLSLRFEYAMYFRECDCQQDLIIFDRFLLAIADNDLVGAIRVFAEPSFIDKADFRVGDVPPKRRVGKDIVDAGIGQFNGAAGLPADFNFPRASMYDGKGIPDRLELTF